MNARQRARTEPPRLLRPALHDQIRKDAAITLFLECVNNGDFTPMVSLIRRLQSENDKLRKRLGAAHDLIRINAEEADNE